MIDILAIIEAEDPQYAAVQSLNRSLAVSNRMCGK